MKKIDKDAGKEGVYHLSFTAAAFFPLKNRITGKVKKPTVFNYFAYKSFISEIQKTNKNTNEKVTLIADILNCIAINLKDTKNIWAYLQTAICIYAQIHTFFYKE